MEAVGIPVEKSFYDLPRSHQSIVEFNRRVSPWCDAQLGKKWGLGNIKKYQISPSHAFKRVPDSVQTRVSDLCPRITTFADGHVKTHFSPEYIFFSSVANDVLKRKAVAGLRALKHLVRH